MSSVYTILCLIFFVSKYGDGKILSGQLVTDKNWAFLARFCFRSEKGKFRYDFAVGGDPTEKSNVDLLLYYDAPSQWASIYPSNLTCEQKISVLNIERGQIVSLTTKNAARSGCKRSNDSSGNIRCTSYREFLSARPRWWFMALADCSSQNGLNVTYWISLTNGSPGSFWREHFSADEFYILPELIAAACVYVILVAFGFYTAIQLRSRRLLHVSYKIFLISMICQLMGISCEIYSQTRRGLTGVDSPTFSLTGALFEAYSETLYTVLLFLLALGYTVTKSQLTRRQIMWLFLFVGISVIFQLSLYIYQSEVFDPGLVLYIYESPPGYNLLALKICAWVVFVMCCYTTSRKTTTKFLFYASLLSLGSAWFLCHPITVLAITLLVEAWVRESVVKGCSLSIVLLGHGMFLYITRPASSNARFPFHIRTCQVVPAGVGQNHSYEPRTRTAAALFTVSQSTSSNDARSVR